MNCIYEFQTIALYPILINNIPDNYLIQFL
jgi:hypothetical protein